MEIHANDREIRGNAMQANFRKCHVHFQLEIRDGNSRVISGNSCEFSKKEIRWSPHITQDPILGTRKGLYSQSCNEL